MLITLAMSFPFLICAQHKRFVRTINYAGRYLPSRAKVAFDNSLAVQVATKRPARAGYYACPAANTLFHIDHNLITYGLFVHRTCKTRIDTPGLSAVATLNRKRNFYISLDMHTRSRTRSLLFKCF